MNEIDSASNQVKFFVEHLGLKKYLRTEPTGECVWVNPMHLRGVFFFSLQFKLETEPLLQSLPEQLMSNFRGIISDIEESPWFRAHEEKWLQRHCELEKEIKELKKLISDLQKYETHYNLQMKLNHGSNT